MVNTTLQKLSIHYNKIGDGGMSIISEAIKHNKTLTILWAWNCGFSVKGTIVHVVHVYYHKTYITMSDYLLYNSGFNY